MENLPPEARTVPLPPELPSETAADPPVEEDVAAPTVEKSAARRERSGIGTPVLVGGGYLAFFRLTTEIPSDSFAVVALTTLISLALVLLFTVVVARSIRSTRALVVNLALSACLAVPPVLFPLLAVQFRWSGWELVFRAMRAFYKPTFHIFPGVQGLFLIWLASSVGVLVSRLVRELKLLLPIAVALACVDLYVVFGGGLVTQAQHGNLPAQRAMQALTVKLPTVQPRGHAVPMVLAAGFADYLFIALFFACFARFEVPSRRTFYALCVVLAAYMAVVAVKGIDLPALAPIAVVVIGMNLRRFRYERSEGFALLYAGIIVAAVMAVLIHLSR